MKFLFKKNLIDSTKAQGDDKKQRIIEMIIFFLIFRSISDEYQLTKTFVGLIDRCISTDHHQSDENEENEVTSQY